MILGEIIGFHFLDTLDDRICYERCEWQLDFLVRILYPYVLDQSVQLLYVFEKSLEIDSREQDAMHLAKFVVVVLMSFVGFGAIAIRGSIIGSDLISHVDGVVEFVEDIRRNRAGRDTWVIISIMLIKDGRGV